MIVFFFFVLSATNAQNLGFFQHGRTYCVGGFNTSNPSQQSQHACNSFSVSLQHRNWHEHTGIIQNTKTNECFICWDESDDTCDSIFMTNHSEFIYGYKGNCTSDSTAIFEHVKDGITIQAPSSPPVEDLRPEVFIRNGPYAEGESLRITGNLLDANNQIAKNNGTVIAPSEATISIMHNGTELLSVPAIVQSDGSFEGDVVLPKLNDNSLWSVFTGTTEEISIVVNVKNDALPAKYKLQSNSVEKKIHLTKCKDNLFIDTPGSTPVASLIPMDIKYSMNPDHLMQSSINIHIKVTDPSMLKDASQAEQTLLGANGNVSWIPPELLDPTNTVGIKIYVSGIHNGIEICPSNPQTYSLSGESIIPESFIMNQASDNLLGLPKMFTQPQVCVVGEKCEIKVQLKVAPNASVPFLDDPNTPVSIIDNSENVLYQNKLNKQTTFTYDFIPQKAGTINPKVRFGEKEQMTSFDSNAIVIREPITFGLAETIDFGHVLREDWKDHCQVIDLNTAHLQSQDGLRLAMHNFDPSCDMSLYYVNDPQNTQYVDQVQVKSDDGNGYVDLILPTTKRFGVCVKPGDCGADDSPANASISLIPLDPALRSFTSKSNVKWTSVKLPFWAWDCWGELLTYMVSTLSLGIFVYGYTSAPRFAFHHGVKFSHKSNMSNAVTYTFVEERRCKLKLFNGQQIKFNYAGEPVFSSGSITCRAITGGLFVVNGTNLEYLDNSTGTWRAIEDEEYMPSGVRLYRLKGDKLYISFYI